MDPADIGILTAFAAVGLAHDVKDVVDDVDAVIDSPKAPVITDDRVNELIDAKLNARVGAHMDHIDKLLSEAEEYVCTHDRKLYEPYFRACEEFMAPRGCVWGGACGRRLAAGDNIINKNTFAWDLYCDDIYATSKALCDHLAKLKVAHVDMRTLRLVTSIVGRELEIFVEERSMFKLFALDRYRGVKLVEVMQCPKVVGYFGAEVSVMPAMFGEIDDLQRRYTPNMVGQWDEITVGARVGGFDKNRAVATFAKFIRAHESVILIGDYAYADSGRLQFITDLPPDELKQMCAQALNAEKHANTRVANTYDSVGIYPVSVCLPSDFQLRKWKLQVEAGGRQWDIADVFNSTTYEQIPYHGSKYKIAGPLVIARFALIEVWLLRLVERISNISMTGRIDELMKLRDRAMTEWADSGENLGESFLGVNISARTMKKKYIMKQRRVPVYFPFIAK